MPKFFVLLFVLSTCVLSAQQPVSPSPQQQSIIVTGTAEPVPLAEADRDISAIKLPEKQRTLYDSWFDVLRLDPALDLQQRASGFQGDLSIRGATFGQTLVLINGLRLNDVQTGHFNLDLPLPLEMISGIEVLKGAGSTLYGSDAIGGVVNVRTEPIEPGELRLLADTGNFGVNQQHGIATFGRRLWQEEVAFARDFSSGFVPDRDYRNLTLSSLSTLTTKVGVGHLLLAYSDRPFGANNFYGVVAPQWERTKSWFVSGQQTFGERTEASFAYRKHTDLYVFLRDNPSYYTNWHTDEEWQGELRRHDSLPRHGVISYGVQGLSESLKSTNLGTHSRTRGSGYVFYDLRSARRYSLSAGIREEVYSTHSVVTSPSISGAAWLSSRVKLRAASSRAFRLPSYTELYYVSPSTIGNSNLKPESAVTYEAGIDAYVNHLHASITAFQRRDSNVIDYVRASMNVPWMATNFNKLHFTGIEVSAVYEPRAGQHLSMSFSELHGVNSSSQAVLSEYTFNYPSHAAVFEWRGTVHKSVIARTRIGVVDRVLRTPYAVWDASAGYGVGHVRPFIQLTNITSTAYEDIPLVAEPKRAFIVGMEVYVFGSSR